MVHSYFVSPTRSLGSWSQVHYKLRKGEANVSRFFKYNFYSKFSSEGTSFTNPKEKHNQASRIAKHRKDLEAKRKPAHCYKRA
jgi:hypothetical protein